MKQGIQTGLFRLYNPKMDWGVAHLYEHLLIQTFQNYIEKLGYSPYLYGWVAGETFQDVIFIEYGFYNPKVEKLFEKFINSEDRIDSSLIHNEVVRIEAEEGSLINVSNHKVLVKKLQELAEHAFVSVEKDSDIVITGDSQNSISLITQNKSKKSFKDITITVGLGEASLEEKALFLRMTPIIFDLLNSLVYSKGLYQKHISWPIYKNNHDAMLAFSVYTIKKSTYTNKELETLIIDALLEADFTKHEKELQCYAHGFMSTPLWNTFPIDYFRYTGILVSRKNVAELLTVDNIQSVIKRLKINVSNGSDEQLEFVKN